MEVCCSWASEAAIIHVNFDDAAVAVDDGTTNRWSLRRAFKSLSYCVFWSNPTFGSDFGFDSDFLDPSRVDYIGKRSILCLENYHQSIERNGSFRMVPKSLSLATCDAREEHGNSIAQIITPTTHS